MFLLLAVSFISGCSNQSLSDEILNEAFATVREVGKRVMNMRHFYVKLIGGMVLHNGKIVKSGPKELAHELEEKGYDWIKEEVNA